MRMPNITLALDEETYREVKKHPEISWSEVARQAIRRKLREVHMLDAAFAESELTEEDVARFADEAKERLLQRFLESMEPEDG